MSAVHAEDTRPEIEIPAAPRGSRLRSVPAAGDGRAQRAGQPAPVAGGVGRPQRSFLPPERQRGLRPMQTGGQPPTVIRNLDALFAADQRRKSTPPPAAAKRADPVSGVQPLDPARFAQALLDKVERDFARPAPAPEQVRFVVSSPSPSGRVMVTAEITAQIPLDPDDADLVQLVPWYRRMWTRFFGA